MTYFPQYLSFYRQPRPNLLLPLIAADAEAEAGMVATLSTALTAVPVEAEDLLPNVPWVSTKPFPTVVASAEAAEAAEAAEPAEAAEAEAAATATAEAAAAAVAAAEAIAAVHRYVLVHPLVVFPSRITHPSVIL